MYQRTHPIMIVSNLRRVLYLIIIPVLRGLFSALQKDLLAWIEGAWIDVVILLLMVTIAALRWNGTTYAYDNHIISIRSNFIFQRDTIIFWERVTAVSMVQSFYLRPFGAVHLRADTMGGSMQNADLSVFLSREQGRALLAMTGRENGETVKRQYVPRARSILTMSLLTSNSFAGIVFIATFVSQSGKLLGNEFADLIVSAFEDIARTLAFGIPPAAAAIAYVLLGGWLVGFLFTFISYRDFVIYRQNTTLSIRGGVITPREYEICYDRINFLDIRQNVAAKALRQYSLYISAVGYGKVKDDISCIIPNEKALDFEANRRMLFPNFRYTEPTIRSPRRGLFRFVGQPIFFCLGILLTMGLLIWLFPSWVSFITFVGLMSLVPPMLFLVIRILAFFSGGIGRQAEYFTLSYSTWFNLHKVIVPASKIVSVKLRQSIFQQYGRSRTCDLIVCTVAEGQSKHLCRNLPIEEVKKLFGDHPAVQGKL